MSRQAAYRSRYRAENPGWHDSSRLFRQLLGQVTGATTRLLDIGCGRRGLGPDLIGKTGSVIGADSDVPALRDNTDIRSRVAALAEWLPFADGSFDVVSLRFIVEHLPDPERVFAEISRVLSPGGHIAILTPNALNPVTWIIRGVPNRFHPVLNERMFGRNGRDTYPVQYRANSLAKLDRMLGAAGFTREAVALNGDPSYLAFGPVSYAISRALERVLAVKPLRAARVHIIAMYRKD